MSNSRQERKEIIKRIVYMFQVYLPFLIGFGIVLSIRKPDEFLLRSLGYFLAGFSGVIMIIRKESPTSRRIIRGRWAILSGIIFTMLWWGGSLLNLLFGLR